MVLLEKILSVDTLDKNPTVIFLPGSLFFVQSVDLPGKMERAELQSFVEIALEERSPFPINQIYYGAYHTEVSNRALVFAAYRKRFTSGEKEIWEDADLVVPDFVSLFGRNPREPAIHVLLQENTASAVCFDGNNPVPVDVVSRQLDAEASPREHDVSVEGLVSRVRAVHGDVPVRYFRRQGEVVRHKGRVEFPSVPVSAEGEARGERQSESGAIDRSLVSGLDVRDKEFLAERRKTATRDAWFWRSTMTLAAILVLLTLGEIVLVIGSGTLENRQELVEARADEVARILEQQELAERMEELGRNQLLPFDMLAVLNEHRPSSLHFISTATSGWNGMQVNAVTNNTADVSRYESALRDSGHFGRIEIRNQRVSDGQTTFVLEAEFLPDFLRERSGLAQGGTSDVPALAATVERRAP